MIVGLTGEKRSGKDTVAGYLCRNWYFNRIALADPIRRMCKDIFGWSEDWIEGHKEEVDPRWGISYRQAAQLIGTDLFRIRLPQLNEDFSRTVADQIWVRSMLDKLDHVRRWVVPDVRFPDEAKVIRSKGGVILRVTRPERGVGEDSHASESYYGDIQVDGVLENKGTIDDLYIEVFITMKELFNA